VHFQAFRGLDFKIFPGDTLRMLVLSALVQWTGKVRILAKPLCTNIFTTHKYIFSTGNISRNHVYSSISTSKFSLLSFALPLFITYLLCRPFKKIKLVGNKLKGLPTNFPKWQEPQTKLYLYIILPQQLYYY
jgi:hypothetical protein